MSRAVGVSVGVVSSAVGVNVGVVCWAVGVGKAFCPVGEGVGVTSSAVGVTSGAVGEAVGVASTSVGAGVVGGVLVCVGVPRTGMVGVGKEVPGVEVVVTLAVPVEAGGSTTPPGVGICVVDGRVDGP